MQYHTLESRVSSDIQTPLSWLKNSAIASFFNPLLGVWISDETLFLVYDVLHPQQVRDPVSSQMFRILHDLSRLVADLLSDAAMPCLSEAFRFKRSTTIQKKAKNFPPSVKT